MKLFKVIIVAVLFCALVKAQTENNGEDVVNNEPIPSDDESNEWSGESDENRPPFGGPGGPGGRPPFGGPGGPGGRPPFGGPGGHGGRPQFGGGPPQHHHHGRPGGHHHHRPPPSGAPTTEVPTTAAPTE